MTITWIPWAIKLPATYDPKFPAGKHYDARTLDSILYVVNHSAEGGIGYLKQGHRPGEQASWMFSVALNGTLYQHYPLEHATWTSGRPVPNQEGVGVEHEGTKPNKFTDEQADTDVRLFLALRAICPNLGAPTKGQGVRIHREVSPGTTTCPNDRDRYDKYAAIGGDMANETGNAALVAFAEYMQSTNKVWGKPNETRAEAWSRALGELDSGEKGDLFPLLRQAASKKLTGTFTGGE